MLKSGNILYLQKFIFLVFESSACPDTFCGKKCLLCFYILILIRLGVGHLVTTTCKDVCGKYSGDEGGFSGVADQIADAGKINDANWFELSY